MFIAFGLLTVFIIWFIAVSHKNKFMYAIIAMMSALFLLMIAATLYSAKVSAYRFFFRLDYEIAYLFYGLRLRLESVVNMYNLSLALLMAASSISFIIFSGIKKRYIPLLLIPAVLFFIWLAPKIVYSVYIGTLGAGSAVMRLKNITDIVMEAMFWIYIFAPSAVIIWQIIKTKIFTKRKDLMVFGSITLLLNAFILVFFRFGEFSHIWFTNVDFTKLPNYRGIADASIGMPSAMIFLICGVAGILLCFRPNETFFVIHRKTMLNQRRDMNKNLSIQFHAYKNAFLTLGQQLSLMDMYSEKGENEKVKERIRASVHIVKDNVESLERKLTLLKNDDEKLIMQKIDLLECINESIERVAGNAELEICGNYTDAQPMIIYGSGADITESISNILINALESVEAAGRNPQIEINVYSEQGYYMIEIADNGKGIEKKNIKRIFNKFYSTKACSKSGGVGLDYVKNVVLAHHGEIKAVSKPDENAVFQMAFRTYN